MNRIKEILRRIDTNMTLWCAGGLYRWRWWQHVRNPYTYLIIAVFLLCLYLAD